MDDNQKLDYLVKQEFKLLKKEIRTEEHKFINPKSIENFILHLIEKPHHNPKKNRKLQELGEIRMKKKLLEYFNAVRNTNLDESSASDLYVRYFTKIGEFMRDYYGFSSGGGKSIVIDILIIIAIGLGIDTILYLLDWIDFPLISGIFLSIYGVRRLIKHRERKQYGLFY